MTLIYDKTQFASFRKKAITVMSKITIGMQIYCVMYGQCTVVKILTDEGKYAIDGLICEWPNPKSFWIELLTNWQESKIISCMDHNIEASYNPWLLFSDLETMQAYKKDFVPTIANFRDDFGHSY